MPSPAANFPKNHHTVVKTGIVIIGAGFSGIGMAIQLLKQGIDDFLILERDSDIGGTWLVNTYPGCACDVQSHLYSYSFELNPNWTRAFSSREEIWHYQKRCVGKYGLERYIRFQQRVIKAVFDNHRMEWHITTQQGTEYHTKAMILATGPLNRPKYPEINGLHSFQGALFHTAAWKHDYPVKDKRVAVIGTGASAIQVIPSIAPEAEHLYVFQRTPAWVLPRPDRKIFRIEKWLFRNMPIIMRLNRELLYWRLESRGVFFFMFPSMMRYLSLAGKWNINRAIKDKALRKKLTPQYTMGCKRILLSNDYYPTFNRQNVTLVTNPVKKIDAKSIYTEGGGQFEVDVIVCATGFEASENMAPFEILGLNGKDLRDAWRDGGEAYLGTVVSGYPNMFMVIGPNTGLGHNSMIHIMESQYRYILQALKLLLKHRGSIGLNVKEAVQQAYNEEIQQRLRNTVWQSGGCMSWYLNRQGKNTTLWPGFTFEFRRKLSELNLEAFELLVPVKIPGKITETVS